MNTFNATNPFLNTTNPFLDSNWNPIRLDDRQGTDRPTAESVIDRAYDNYVEGGRPGVDRTEDIANQHAATSTPATEEHLPPSDVPMTRLHSTSYPGRSVHCQQLVPEPMTAIANQSSYEQNTSSNSGDNTKDLLKSLVDHLATAVKEKQSDTFHFSSQQ